MGSMSNRHEWPQVHHWALAPFASAEVFRVTLTDGTPAHLRPNDGSALLLPELVARGVPTPSALAQRGGWLLLSEVPGTPASDARWRAHPDSFTRLLSAAWQALQSAEVSHGDLTLPNVLGQGRGRTADLPIFRPKTPVPGGRPGPNPCSGEGNSSLSVR